jgi:Uma2 family endonuclease
MATPQLAYPIPRRLTRTEYDRMIELGFFRGERLELIRGTLLRMSPIGPPHATAVSRLNRLLVTRLSDRAEVRIQQPIVAADDSEPEPDVAVVPLGDYSREHPHGALLVIEVADSSLSHDRKTKAELYAESNVREYWVVDLTGRTFEVFTEPSGNRYASVRRVSEGESVASGAFDDLVIAVDDVIP